MNWTASDTGLLACLIHAARRLATSEATILGSSTNNSTPVPNLLLSSLDCDAPICIRSKGLEGDV